MPKLIRIVRENTTASIEPEKIRERNAGVTYVCADGKCDTKQIMFLKPLEVTHTCPPGSRKIRPLVPQT